MTVATRARGTLKCVVWDLDDTIWDGTLLEQASVRVRPEVVAVIAELDRRGILHSVASRNDPDSAWAELERCGLSSYLLAPQIGWGTKSGAVRRVAETLNLGLDAILFVDDQAFEREEVAFSLPEVTCVDADEAPALPNWPELTPRFVTDESRTRRQVYRSELARRDAEANFDGSPADFLASCGITVELAPLAIDDLRRAEELTVRTHQMNSTGGHYSYERLARLREDPSHLAFAARLNDRFGNYGTVGLALVEQLPGRWQLRLLLASCRVASRGIGGILLAHVQRLARAEGVPLYADLLLTERNRAMEITYRFAGFELVGGEGVRREYLDRRATAPEFPPHLTVIASG